MSLSQHVQALYDATPAWLNWITIAGGAVLAWIQPVAGIVAIVWGCLQIYGWFEKRRRKGH